MTIDVIKRVAGLAGQEWRRFRYSPIWMLGCVSGALLAWSESDSSNVLGYPTLNQALYGFQLGVSVVFGFMAFLLASGSLAMDLDGSRKDLVFSRAVNRAEFVFGKFSGVFLFSLLAVLPVLVVSIGAPLLHGVGRIHHPGPFLSVLFLCVVPMLGYVTALGLALTSLFRKVIVVLPPYVLYFFTAALMNPARPGGINYLDFSQRLYPRELVVHVPLMLREYTFTGLLSPLSADLLVRSGLYVLLALLLLAGAWLSLRLDLDTRLAGIVARRLRSLRRHRPECPPLASTETAQAKRAVEAPALVRQPSSAAAQWFRNEMTLLHYSARMLAGRNLIATVMILAALFLLITTYRVGPMQTRTGVMLLQLETFAPLLGIIMFSDVVAAEFEARRADLLRTSRRGGGWVVWHKLMHATIFSAVACVLLLGVLRTVYSRFDVLQALSVVLPGVFFYGLIGLLAASAARRSLVGYAAGTAAMVLSLVLKELEPLTPTSFHVREHLANGRLLGEWNWLLAKLVFCILAALLAATVLRLMARPELTRRLAGSAAGLLAVTYVGLHLAWSGGDGTVKADAASVDLEAHEEGSVRLLRRALITTWRRDNRQVRSAELMDIQLVKKDDRWEVQSQTPVDLTRELEIPHLDLEVTVNPAEARIGSRARFELTVLKHPVEAVRFYLGAELQIQRFSIDGEPATFARHADLVDVKLPRKREPGQQLKIDLQYGGKLQVPQHLGFEGAAKDLLFVTSRWYPSLRGSRPGVRPLFTCNARIRTPRQYQAAACRLLERNDHENLFLWESGGRVEWVPLCVGTFRVYEKTFRDDIGVSFCTFSVKKDYAERMLEKSVRLLRQYEAEYGPYPYRHAAIVENRFQDSGGAAFPSLVTINPERLAPEHEERFATAYLTHELAHLWFGHTVTPWIAESSAVYASCRVLAAEKGKAAANTFLDTEFYPALAAPETTAAPLVRAEGALKYTKGGYLFKMLSDARGEQVMLAALKSLHKEGAGMRRVDFDRVSDDFTRKLKAVAGPEFEGFVEDMTRTVKRLDPAVTGIQTGAPGSGAEARIELQHFGEMRFPVPVAVRFTDGTSQVLVWAGMEEKGFLSVKSTAPIASVEIDPAHDLLDWNRANNRAAPGSTGGPRTGPAPELAGWKTFSVAEGLPDVDIRCLAAAKEGVIAAAWSFQAAVSGRWAVGAVKGNTWEPYAPNAEPVHLVTTIAAAVDGSLWLGSQNQLRCMRGEERTDWLLAHGRRGGPVGAGSFFPIPQAKNGPPGSQVYALLADRAARVWVGTDRGVTVFSRDGISRHHRAQPGLDQREVFALVEDGSGTIWAGTDRGLYRINGDTALRVDDGPKDLVLAIAAGRTGKLWCGTFRSGLWQLTPTSAKPFSYANTPLPDTIFSSVACDGRGWVWAGSPDGLVRFNGKEWKVFNRANSGLPSNRVHCLAVDSSGNVWIGSDAGLSRFAPESLLHTASL